MRFVFSPPADEAAGLLTLPFGEPLEQWRDERLVEIRQRGLSRHVVRFVAEGGELYALKAISERLARREYRLLRALAELNVPAVEVVGIVVDRGPDLDAILVTRFLEYSTTYRALFSSPRVGQPTDRLLDALVELLVRLHLSGFFWGDCSLSNTLFRYDAGTLGAYLVDAETSEQHPELTDGQRNWDVELAVERVSGELHGPAGGRSAAGRHRPVGDRRGNTAPLRGAMGGADPGGDLRPTEQRHRIAKRLRRLNDLGFDADELELISTPDGSKLRIRTKVAEAGQHSAATVPADRDQRRRASGAAPAQRHRQLPRLPGAEERLPGVGDRRGAPVAGGGLRPGGGGDPGRAAGQDRAAGDLPRDPRAPLVPVGAGGPRRRNDAAAATSYFETVLPHAPDPLTTGADDTGEFARPLDV